MTMKLFEKLFRPRPPIRDREALADFIDAQSAFIVQKGIYEYSRARAGHYAKVLFAEEGFAQSVERARWQAFPLGLSMVGEMIEGVLASQAGTPRREILDQLIAVVLSVFDRYPVPPSIGEEAWLEARSDLAHRLDLVGGHAPKRVMDIPEPLAEAYFCDDADPRKAARSRLRRPRAIISASVCATSMTNLLRGQTLLHCEGLWSRAPRLSLRCANAAGDGGAMDRTSGGAPLLALDGVVVDSETTGLDPRKSRVIELAAVRLSAGKLVAGDSFRQLLRPGDESIPAEHHANSRHR